MAHCKALRRKFRWQKDLAMKGKSGSCEAAQGAAALATSYAQLPRVFHSFPQPRALSKTGKTALSARGRVIL